MDESKLMETQQEYPLTLAVPEKLPESTYWPLLLAVGTLFFLSGFIISFVISIIGIIFLGISLAGWIGEFRDE